MTSTKSLHSLLLVLLLGLAPFLASCGGNGTTESSREAPAQAQIPEEPVRGGTAIIGYTGDISGVNILASSSSQPTTELCQRLFLNLLEEQPDYQDSPPTFRPELAESWEFSEDNKALTFRIREGLLWSDGVPITAEDVRWTWEAQVSPEVAWDNASLKATITDVEVVDERTVRFHFTHAYPGQLVHVNEGVILPKHAWEKLPFSEWKRNNRWFVENLVVSGPFDLEEWKPQQEIVLRRNERYFETGKPYLDRAVLRIIPDSASQLTQLLAGSLDFMRQVPAAMADRVAAGPDTKLLTFWPPQFTTLIWNLRNPLFADTQVRQALTLAIDRQAIVDTIWFGYARTSPSPYITSVWGHNPDIQELPYDPDQARKLLAAAGWSDSDGDGTLDRNGKPFRFELMVNAGNQERVDAAVMIQQQLSQVGVDVRPATLDWNAIGDLLDRRAFESTITGLAVETSLDLSPYFHSESIEERLNLSSYSNAEVDRLLEAARSELELENSKPYLYEIQELLHRDQPMTILWEPQRLVGMSWRLQGARPNPISTLHNLHEWWLIPDS